MSEEAKIIQMIPAAGWRAHYWRTYEPYYELVRLISFALVEDSKGQRWVSALDQHLRLCRLNDDFAGFVHEEEMTDEFMAQCSESGQQRAQRK